MQNRKTSTLVLVFAALALLADLSAPAAHAGWFGRRGARRCEAVAAPMPTCGAVPVAPMPMQVMPAATQAPTATTPQAQPTTTGAAGFVAWLNQVRAAHGLAPVAYDPGMEAICTENNRHQAARGLGHHYLGHARRQNSAAGLSFPGVEAAWMGSWGHRDALLDPTITAVGIAWYAGYCTFAAN